MARYAVVNLGTGIVDNVIELDGKSPWQPPAGCEIAPSTTANIGDVWDGTPFVAVPEPPITRAADDLSGVTRTITARVN